MTKARKGTLYHEHEPNAYAGANTNKFFFFLFFPEKCLDFMETTQLQSQLHQSKSC